MLQLDAKLRCDLFVEGAIFVEIKSVKTFAPVHTAKLMTYMKLLKAPKGILLNFNVFNLYNEGQKTFVNDRFALLED